jgi:membrane-associated phospholipid phosphatase
MYFLYQLTYLLVGKLYPDVLHREVAIRNARILIAFERAVGMHNIEISLQSFFVQYLNHGTLMKIINAFYLGAHLPMSLFFFFHLAYCRTLNSANNKRRRRLEKLAREQQQQPIQVIAGNDNSTSAPSASDSSSLAGECIEQEQHQNDRNSKYNSSTADEAKQPCPSIFHPMALLYWVAARVGRSGNLDINSKDYKKFRWSMILIHAMFGITIVILPVAPPRMMTDEGYVDTIIMYTKTELTKTEERLGVNPYAAMPSLHFTYALFVGIGYFIFASRRWLRISGFIYTILVGLIIVITGNHYIMDAVVAFCYVYLCVVLSTKIVAETSQRHVKITLWMEESFEKLYTRLFGNDEDELQLSLLPKNEDEDEEQNSVVVPLSPQNKPRGSPRTLHDV